MGQRHVLNILKVPRLFLPSAKADVCFRDDAGSLCLGPVLVENRGANFGRSAVRERRHLLHRTHSVCR